MRPAVKIIEGPLQRIDQILCSSLDAVEQRVPSVYLPPQLVIQALSVEINYFNRYYSIADFVQHKGVHVQHFGK